MTISKYLFVVAALSSALVFADPAKPRVMVIIDTSRSMLEPTNADTPVIPMSSAGGDWDATTNPTCTNKFCTAKKVVDTIIPQFTGDARIGLATYYQFLLRADKADSRQTQCIYDVLAPAGQLRTFTSQIDLTGSGSTVCAGGANDAACVGPARAVNYPDGFGGTGGANIDGLCKSPSASWATGYVRPATLPNSTAPSCTGLGCYTLTKTAAAPQTPITCDVWVDQSAALPRTYTNAECSGKPGVYTGIQTRTLQPSIRKYTTVGATTCPGTVQAPTTPPTGAGEVYNSLPVGTSAGQFGNLGSLTAADCTAGKPCSLYLANATPVSTTSGRSWYGFFDNTFTPAAGTTSPSTTPAYTFADSTGGTAYVATVPGLTGTRTLPAATPCATTGRYTTGDLAGSFGINNAQSTLDANATLRRNTNAHETPTRVATNNFNCTAGWPCDITLVSDVPVTPTYAAYRTLYSLGDLGNPNPTERIVSPATAGTPSATNSYTLRITNPSVVSCPTFGTTTTNPMPANTTWTTAAPSGCATPTGPCQFSAPSTGSATAPGGTCTSPMSRFNAIPANDPAPCSFNGKAWSSANFANDASSNPYRLTANIPASSSCATGTFNITSLSGYTTTNVTAGAAPNEARITYLSESAGAPQTSATTNNALGPPGGYSGAPATAVDNGAPYQTPSPSAGAPSDPSGGCAGGTGSTIQSSDSTLCGGSTPCTLVVLGPIQTSMTCGASELNKPCYACRYQRRAFTWQRPTKNCLYSATRTEWTVNRQATTCTYTRPQWQTEIQNPSNHTCTYSVGARRYDFVQPTQTWCEYFSVRSTLETLRTLYTYEYLTKGTEPIGRAVSANTAGALCTSTWASANAFGTACPETVPNCTGLTSLTMPATAYLSASTCRLKWGGSNSNLSSGTADPNLGLRVITSGRNDGRFTNYLSANVSFATVDTAHRACEVVAPPANADTYKNESASPRGFCASTGTGPQSQFKLISDFYAPNSTWTDSNGTSLTNANNMAAAYASMYPPAAGWTVTTNNTPFKDQGLSAVMDAGAVVGSGALPARAIFVPIPNDATYNALGQRDAIRSAIRKCVPPSVDPPGADGSLDGGACVADERVVEPAPCTPNALTGRNCGPTGDFTPLYGSLKNTYQYLNDRWTNDENDKQCRDYFIVLATDGLENTPMNYTVGGVDPNTSVQGLVSSFRHNVPLKTRPDVRTFVIALGTGAAGEPALNNVAAAGGTTQAFNATNLAELEAALQAVFTFITQGVYSRSRPALGTDGQRLYAAQFVRPGDAGATPDSYGLLTAFRVNPTDGSFGLAWEHGGKLNHASHPARNIVVGLREKSWPNDKVVGPFTTGNSELMDQLNDHPDFGTAWDAGVTPANIISFLTNKGDSYTGGGTRTSKLGPISHSAPVVVGKSPFDPDYGGKTAAQRTAFATFRTNTETRPVRVMVEANDGMLHSVIEADTAPACTTPGEADPSCPSGREAWSYIPGSLYMGFQNWGMHFLVESLFKLKQGGWAANMLNNTVAIADVCGDGSGEADSCAVGDWKTIAIMSQREGGRGIAAIDVTNGVAPNTSRFLWDFWDGDLGFTYSIPAVGRVEESSDEQFVAIFGGGVDDPNTTGPGETEGRIVYVVNAVTGNLIRKYNKFDKGSSTDLDLQSPVLARPAIHRRPGSNFSFISSAYVMAGESMFAMRFAKADGSMEDDKNKWKPDELFDPTSTRNVSKATCPSPPCSEVEVRQVVETAPGNPAALPTPIPPTYALQPATVDTAMGGKLPLVKAPPIFNRPRIASLLVQSGAYADLLVGTGDVRDPLNPGAEFETNYFYAVHDFNQQPHGSNNDGRALWINQFPRIGMVGTRYEQVVSEPAVLSGCIVVATFTPPVTGASCSMEGDTTLYGFSPLTGDLQPCLTYISPSPYAGQATSVIKMPGVGIPSDLVVINDNVYLSTSRDGLTRAPVRVPPKPGAVRSYRRIK
ncbi:MAG: hypothetical protein GQE15_12305 [Archangiaceae bacterium]|nr:hypothetical protein [Archangiaceae bacterium]